MDGGTAVRTTAATHTHGMMVGTGAGMADGTTRSITTGGIPVTMVTTVITAHGIIAHIMADGTAPITMDTAMDTTTATTTVTMAATLTVRRGATTHREVVAQGRIKAMLTILTVGAWDAIAATPIASTTTPTTRDPSVTGVMVEDTLPNLATARVGATIHTIAVATPAETIRGAAVVGTLQGVQVQTGALLAVLPPAHAARDLLAVADERCQ